MDNKNIEYRLGEDRTWLTTKRLRERPNIIELGLSKQRHKIRTGGRVGGRTWNFYKSDTQPKWHWILLREKWDEKSSEKSNLPWCGTGNDGDQLQSQDETRLDESVNGWQNQNKARAQQVQNDWNDSPSAKEQWWTDYTWLSQVITVKHHGIKASATTNTTSCRHC